METITVLMSHSQFRSETLILRHAWLNLWDKHMTTGRINQVTWWRKHWGAEADLNESSERTTINEVTDVDELHLLKTIRSSADQILITVNFNLGRSSHQDSIWRLRTMTNGCCLAQRPCGVTYHIVYQMRFHGLTSDNFRLVRAEKLSVGRTTSHQSVRSM